MEDLVAKDVVPDLLSLVLENGREDVDDDEDELEPELEFPVETPVVVLLDERRVTEVLGEDDW